MSRVKKIIQQFYWLVTFFGLNRGKSYLATLVKSQKLHKMLRNLTFVVQFAYFSVRPTFEQFFEKSRETFWKISSNLSKALGAGQGFIAVGGGGYFSFAPVPLPKPSPASRFDAHPHTRLGTFETEMATHNGLLPGVGSRSRRSYGKRGDCETTTTEQERIIQFSLAISSCVKSSKV